MYVLEVYEPCDQHPEGHIWNSHHCGGSYDNIDKMAMAICEALADVSVLHVKVRNSTPEDD